MGEKHAGARAIEVECVGAEGHQGRGTLGQKHVRSEGH